MERKRGERDRGAERGRVGQRRRERESGESGIKKGRR